MTWPHAFLCFAYVATGAQFAAYAYGFDQGTDRPDHRAGWGDLLFITLVWPVVVIASMWRDSMGGDE